MTKPAPNPDAARDDRNVVMWAAVALIVTLWIGIPWTASAAAAAPLALYLRDPRRGLRASLLSRWVVTVFLVGLAMAGLGTVRALRAIPTGPWAFAATRNWLDGTGSVAPSAVILCAQVLVFAAAAVATRGLAGVWVLSELVLNAAVAASVVYGRSFNAFEATAVAAAPWTIAAVAGCSVLLSPLRSWRPGRTRTNPVDGSRDVRRSAVIGATLIGLAVVLRLVAAGAFTRIARHLTVG
jgi:hypothetical protein